MAWPGHSPARRGTWCEGTLLKNHVRADNIARDFIGRSLDAPGPGEMLAPSLRTILELRNNRETFGNSLVPPSLQDQYKYNPEMQAYPETPALYRKTGTELGVSLLTVGYAVK